MFWLQRNSRKLRAPAIHRPTGPGRYPSSCKCFFRRNSHSWWFESDSDMCASSGRLRIAPSRYGELNMRLKLALLPRKDFLLITGSLRLPTRLYIDNAKMYRSPQLARIAASLGTLIIHSRPYQPEGRGKIERLFRTLREQFLANLDRKQLLSLDQLNERLYGWIENVYHRSEHSALGTTPLVRWQKDIDHVRPLPPGADLRRLFFHRFDRLVRRDSTFLLHGRLYEAPAPLAGRMVEVRFDPVQEDGPVEVWWEGKLQASARPLDAVANGQLPSPQPASPPAPQPTGINFVELVHHNKPENQPESEEEDAPW